MACLESLQKEKSNEQKETRGRNQLRYIVSHEGEFVINPKSSGGILNICYRFDYLERDRVCVLAEGGTKGEGKNLR